MFPLLAFVLHVPGFVAPVADHGIHRIDFSLLRVVVRLACVINAVTSALEIDVAIIVAVRFVRSVLTFTSVLVVIVKVDRARFPV